MGRTSALLAAVLSLGVGSQQSERIDLGGGVTLEVVKIPIGTFEMGSPSGENGRGPDEEQHRATITDEIWFGRTPVTRGQFARFVQETGYRTDSEKGPSGGFGFDGTGLVQKKEFTWKNPGFPQTDDHPVVIVTYDDALAFVRWLARKSGRRVSLPTEAQWEYACRAGTTTRFYSGDGDSDAEQIAWFKKNSGDGTRPVAQKTANRWGLHDMSGNVYQWCSDLYAAYVPGGGEQGPMDKPRRVLRGGSWLKDAKHVRSAARARNAPGSRNADNGFRIVVGAKETGAGAVTAPPPPPSPAPAPTPAAPIEVPPAPLEPYSPRSTSTSDAGGCATAFVILGLVAIVLVVVVIVMIRRGNRTVQVSQAPGTPLRRAAPRVVDDGFWFDTSGYAPGSVVSYTYTGPNGRVTEQFLIESAREQFIYTGMRPSDIMLGAMIAQQLEDQSRPMPPPPIRPSTSRFRSDFDDRPRRHPPAY